MSQIAAVSFSQGSTVFSCRRACVCMYLYTAHTHYMCIQTIYTYVYITPVCTGMGVSPDPDPAPLDTQAQEGECRVVCAHAQSCPTLCDPLDCSPPGSSVHGVLQARILEWVAISFSMLDHTVVLFLIFSGASILFSTVAAPAAFPPPVHGRSLLSLPTLRPHEEPQVPCTQLETEFKQENVHNDSILTQCISIQFCLF